MNEFEKMVSDLVGTKKPATDSLEEQLKAAEAKAAEIKEQIRKRDEKCEEREIVVRYIPHEPGSAKVVKGAEFIERGKPDNVVALLDAAAGIMAEKEQINRYVLMESLLEAMLTVMETKNFLRGLLK